MSMLSVNRIPEILKRMDLNIGQAEAMKTCFGILAIMSREDSNKTMIAKDGMEIMLNAMTSHIDRTDVQEAGCDLLWSLAFNSSAVKEIISKYSGEVVLVRALKRHTRSPDFLKSACGALSNICQWKLNQEAVAQQGGLQPLVGSIHIHQTNPKLLPFIFDAIASIIVNNEDNARNVSSLGIIPVAVATLSRHKSCKEVVKSGCHTLAILSDVKGQASKISFAGGVPVILSLLDLHPLYSDLHRVAAVVLLRMLQESNHVGREICCHEGVRILLYSLEKGGAQQDTVAAVTHILYSITNPNSPVLASIEPQLWVLRNNNSPSAALQQAMPATTATSAANNNHALMINGNNRAGGSAADQQLIAANVALATQGSNLSTRQTSLGGLVNILGQYVNRRDVVRAGCRLITNLSGFPQVCLALDELHILERIYECINIHRDTKDILEAAATLMKGICYGSTTGSTTKAAANASTTAITAALPGRSSPPSLPSAASQLLSSPGQLTTGQLASQPLTIKKLVSFKQITANILQGWLHLYESRVYDEEIVYLCVEFAKQWLFTPTTADDMGIQQLMISYQPSASSAAATFGQQPAGSSSPTAASKGSSSDSTPTAAATAASATAAAITELWYQRAMVISLAALNIYSNNTHHQQQRSSPTHVATSPTSQLQQQQQQQHAKIMTSIVEFLCSILSNDHLFLPSPSSNIHQPEDMNSNNSNCNNNKQREMISFLQTWAQRFAPEKLSALQLLEEKYNSKKKQQQQQQGASGAANSTVAGMSRHNSHNQLPRGSISQQQQQHSMASRDSSISNLSLTKQQQQGGGQHDTASSATTATFSSVCGSRANSLTDNGSSTVAAASSGTGGDDTDAQSIRSNNSSGNNSDSSAHHHQQQQHFQAFHRHNSKLIAINQPDQVTAAALASQQQQGSHGSNSNGQQQHSILRIYPAHSLKDTKQRLLDNWPNYLERLLPNPTESSIRYGLPQLQQQQQQQQALLMLQQQQDGNSNDSSILHNHNNNNNNNNNSNSNSNGLRMHLCYESLRPGGKNLPSRLPTPIPYTLPIGGIGTPYTHSLTFDSEFESGNLYRVVQVGEATYDLLLRADVHTQGHTQWFYFAVSNTHPAELVRLAEQGVQVPSVRVVFNLVNFTKPDSLFNLGMRPVIYSVTDARKQGTGWVRSGMDISYYSNSFSRNNNSGEGNGCYYTLTFSMEFHHVKDTVLIAYSYPYTLSDYRLQMTQIVEKQLHIERVMKRMKLCNSLAGEDCDLLVITDFTTGNNNHNNNNNNTNNEGNRDKIGPISPNFVSEQEYSNLEDCVNQGILGNPKLQKGKEWKNYEKLKQTLRPALFLSARVHPGETPASWMMKGIIEFLISDNPAAIQLRKFFVIFIVPILNPDGVSLGNNRCSLAGVDLNRQWKNPARSLHPTIYALKMFMAYQKRIRDIVMYIDLHGHSRKYNVFMYGCDGDKKKPKPQVRAFARCLANHNVGGKYVCFNDCSFHVKKGREATARVVVAKEMNIPYSFTLEATFCGSNYGPLKNCHMNIGHLQEVGASVCDAFLQYMSQEAAANGLTASGNGSSSSGGGSGGMIVNSQFAFYMSNTVMNTNNSNNSNSFYNNSNSSNRPFTSNYLESGHLVGVTTGNSGNSNSQSSSSTTGTGAGEANNHYNMTNYRRSTYTTKDVVNLTTNMAIDDNSQQAGTTGIAMRTDSGASSGEEDNGGGAGGAGNGGGGGTAGGGEDTIIESDSDDEDDGNEDGQEEGGAAVGIAERGEVTPAAAAAGAAEEAANISTNISGIASDEEADEEMANGNSAIVAATSGSVTPVNVRASKEGGDSSSSSVKASKEGGSSVKASKRKSSKANSNSNTISQSSTAPSSASSPSHGSSISSSKKGSNSSAAATALLVLEQLLTSSRTLPNGKATKESSNSNSNSNSNDGSLTNRSAMSMIMPSESSKGNPSSTNNPSKSLDLPQGVFSRRHSVSDQQQQVASSSSSVTSRGSRHERLAAASSTSLKSNSAKNSAHSKDANSNSTTDNEEKGLDRVMELMYSSTYQNSMKLRSGTDNSANSNTGNNSTSNTSNSPNNMMMIVNNNRSKTSHLHRNSLSNTGGTIASSSTATSLELTGNTYSKLAGGGSQSSKLPGMPMLFAPSSGSTGFDNSSAHSQEGSSAVGMTSPAGALIGTGIIGSPLQQQQQQPRKGSYSGISNGSGKIDTTSFESFHQAVSSNSTKDGSSSTTTTGYALPRLNLHSNSYNTTNGSSSSSKG